ALAARSRPACSRPNCAGWSSRSGRAPPKTSYGAGASSASKRRLSRRKRCPTRSCSLLSIRGCSFPRTHLAALGTLSPRAGRGRGPRRQVREAEGRFARRLFGGVEKHRLRCLAQNFRGFACNAGALKKAWVLRAPQFHRVGEGEVPEIVGRDQFVLNQFPGLG